MLDCVYVALLHHPVTNRRGEPVTTAVTNMDIHDISRTARTFGMAGYFLVTPLEEQIGVADRIIQHWRTDQAREWHPDRVEAVSLVRMARSFDEVKAAIRAKHGMDPEVVLTDARPIPKSISYAEYRRELEDRAREKNPRPVVLVFGTGWGISDAFYPEVNRILAPVYGPEGERGYNHLSVRAAAAIILDRLFGL